MAKVHYEVVEIEQVMLTVDISLLSDDNPYFNATEMAKAFGKKPDDYLRTDQTQAYCKALELFDNSQRENMRSEEISPKQALTRVQNGGKYKGTWFRKDLALDFARWLSPRFAVYLDHWIVDRFKEYEQAQIQRRRLKTGYLPMTDAIQAAHEDPKFYHYTNEADMLNRIVVGMTAKKFKKLYNVENVRDALSAGQQKYMRKLQKINTVQIDLEMPFEERKELLKKYYKTKLLSN